MSEKKQKLDRLRALLVVLRKEHGVKYNDFEKSYGVPDKTLSKIVAKSSKDASGVPDKDVTKAIEQVKRLIGEKNLFDEFTLFGKAAYSELYGEPKIEFKVLGKDVAAPDLVLSEWYGASERGVIGAVEKHYSGIWYVCRLASNSGEDQQGPIWNVGVLNIIPRGVAGSGASDSLQIFKYRHRGLDSSERDSMSYVGRVVPVGHYVCLVGAVSAATNRYPSLLRWRMNFLDPESPHADSIKLLVSAYNSDGDAILALGMAFFVKGSDKLEGDEFRRKWEECLKRMGPMDRNKVSELLDDSENIAHLDRLLDRSTRAAVFKLRE